MMLHVIHYSIYYFMYIVHIETYHMYCNDACQILSACTSTAACPGALVALARCSGAHDGDAVRCLPWHLKDCTAVIAFD